MIHFTRGYASACQVNNISGNFVERFNKICCLLCDIDTGQFLVGQSSRSRNVLIFDEISADLYEILRGDWSTVLLFADNI